MTPENSDALFDAIQRLRIEFDNPRCDHWIKLADIALERARESQARIKEHIRPHVERYHEIRQKRQRTVA